MVSAAAFQQTALGRIQCHAYFFHSFPNGTGQAILTLCDRTAGGFPKERICRPGCRALRNKKLAFAVINPHMNGNVIATVGDLMAADMTFSGQTAICIIQIPSLKRDRLIHNITPFL
jgi:hypothetical protein